MKEEIIKLRNEGFSYNEISKKLNCSKSNISYHCSKLEINDEKIKKNIKSKKQKKVISFLLNIDQVEDVIQHRKNKRTYKEIIKLTGLSINVIKKICREYGLIDSRPYGKVIDSENYFQDLYDKHKSIRKVADITGYDRGTLRKHIVIDVVKKLDRKKQIVRNVINWRKRTKLKLVDYKGGKCEKCGYNKCVEALEFHHRDPKEKDFNISGKSWSFERLKNEVEKCILVCSNCHKEIHSVI